MSCHRLRPRSAGTGLPRARAAARGGWMWAVHGALLLVLLLAGLRAAADPPQMRGLTPDEREWLRAHPVLRIGVNASAPPFSYAEQGRHRGIDADIVRRLGQLLGVRLDPVLDRPWDEIQAMARDGRVDMIGLVPDTPERREHLRFTVPVTDVEYALFVRADAAASAAIGDLVGRRVAVVGTFAVRRWLERDYPGVQIVPAASAIDALQRLSTGQVDGAVSTVGAGSWLIREKGIVNLRVAQTLYRTPLAIGLRKDWPQLETMLNKAIAQLPPSEIARIKADYVRLSQEGYSRGQIAMAVGATALGGAVVALIVTVIALRRQRDLARRGQTSEQRFRLLYEHSLDAVLMAQPDGTVIAANPAACAMFGRSEAELRALGRAGLVDASDPRVAALVAERARTGRALGAIRMRRGDGSTFEVEVSSALYEAPDGARMSSIIIRDISVRHRAETQLRLLQAAVANLNDVVIITEAAPLDEPGPRIVYVNEAFTRVTGWAPAEVLGRSPRLLQNERTSRAELARVGAALRQGRPVLAELLNQARDGREYWVEMQIVPLADETSGRVTHLVAVERLIDERKQAEQTRQSLEAQLRASQKMEAIGTLAGGIAHDFNNVVGAILGDAALARQELPPGHALLPALQRIERAGLRARRLIEQILTFSRHRPTALGPVPLAPLIEETASLLRSTLPATVRLETRIADDALHVAADPTQLQQVLMNLGTNAWQAMPGGNGRIVLGLRGSAEGGPAQPAPGLPPGRYAVLSVEDDGAGMDAATMARIFEPFFTTKPPGQGTGLGLAVVHGIVREHHGTIEVHSTPGVGTRFEIWLPQIEVTAPTAAAPEPPRALVPSGHGERVLYVDDDEVMRLMVERLLDRLGYEPEAVPDPHEALRRVSAQPEHYDVVVTDYNMPGMDGLQLAQAIRESAPRLPVVLSSGFFSEALEAQAHDAGVRALLRKERTLEDLPLLLGPLVASAGSPAVEETRG